MSEVTINDLRVHYVELNPDQEATQPNSTQAEPLFTKYFNAHHRSRPATLADLVSALQKEGFVVEGETQ